MSHRNWVLGLVGGALLGTSAMVGGQAYAGLPPTWPDAEMRAHRGAQLSGVAVRDGRDLYLRLAKGEAEEHYHPAEGESPESINAKTDALEAAKNVRRGQGRPGVGTMEPSGRTSQEQAPQVEGPRVHPQLLPEQRIDEHTHETVIP